MKGALYDARPRGGLAVTPLPGARGEAAGRG